MDNYNRLNTWQPSRILDISSCISNQQPIWILLAVGPRCKARWNYPYKQLGRFSQLGFDTQGVYITNNMFQFNGGFQYVKLRILNKSELYSGSVLRSHDFWNLRNPDSSIAFTLQPAVQYTGSGGNPPA
jgi:hypothetical protein